MIVKRDRQVRQKAHIKKGDIVVVIAGRERGKTGKVLAVNASKALVTVEKLNIIKRHTKPTQKNKQGGILEREGSFSLSNVMVYSEGLQKPSRVGIKTMDDGRRVRILKRNPDEILDKV